MKGTHRHGSIQTTTFRSTILPTVLNPQRMQTKHSCMLTPMNELITEKKRLPNETNGKRKILKGNLAHQCLVVSTISHYLRQVLYSSPFQNSSQRNGSHELNVWFVLQTQQAKQLCPSPYCKAQSVKGLASDKQLYARPYCKAQVVKGLSQSSL